MTLIQTSRVLTLTASVLALAACAHGTPPPEISLDEPTAAPVALIDPPKPVEIVSAISDKLSSAKPSRDITPNVPMSESGRAMPGMMVARQDPRNR